MIDKAPSTARTLPRLTALSHHFDEVCISHDGTDYTVAIRDGKSRHSFSNAQLGRAIAQLITFYKLED